MKIQLYKNIALSFIVINIWTLYSFFDYYNSVVNEQYNMSSMTLAFNFIDSVCVAIAVGILSIILRLTIFRKQKQDMLKNNFFYILVGFFNLNLLTIWIISLCMGFLPLKTSALWYMLGISPIAIFILFDVLKKRMSQLECKQI